MVKIKWMENSPERKVLFLFALFFICYFDLPAQNGTNAQFCNTIPSCIDFGPASELNGLDTLSKGDSLSITLWARWGDFNDPCVGLWANLFTSSDSIASGDNGVWWMQHNSTNSVFEFALHTNSRSYVHATTPLVAGVWYHVAATYDGSFIRIYIDGNMETSLAKTGNIRPFPAATKLTMGSWPNPGNGFRRFSGNIDEVSLWNKALSPAQINDMMANPENLTGANYDTINLLGYWNFDNATANDLTSFDNNGTVCSDVILSTKLTSFDVKALHFAVELYWQTLTEVNNAYFTIEKSKTAIDNWSVIETVNGAGNSSDLINYKIIDKEPFAGLSYYRLKQTNLDGKSEYSEIKAVNVKLQDNGLLIYPNPTNNEITIQAINPEEIQNIIIYNTLGQDVTIGIRQLSKNDNQTVVDLTEQPSGIYLIKTRTTSNNVYKR
jgi:hypothetical protein